jgi:hypothetical protein
MCYNETRIPIHNLYVLKNLGQIHPDLRGFARPGSRQRTGGNLGGLYPGLLSGHTIPNHEVTLCEP